MPQYKVKWMVASKNHYWNGTTFVSSITEAKLFDYPVQAQDELISIDVKVKAVYKPQIQQRALRN